MNAAAFQAFLDSAPAPLGWALLHSLWQGLAVAAVFLIARRLLPASPALRYRLAAAALLVFAVWPAATAWRASAELDAAAATAVTAETLVPIAAVPVPAAPVSADPVVRAEGSPIAFLSLAAVERWLPWICLAWLAGVALIAARHVAGLVGAARLRRRGTRPAPDAWIAKVDVLSRRIGVRHHVDLLESLFARVPVVVGWLKPAIIVPYAAFAGMPPAQLEAILAHELAHVRRQDFLVNLLQTIVETLYFYHPVAFFLSREMRRERELCCDDLAVEACGDKRTYAHALAAVAELRLGSGSLVMAADGHDPLSLRHRIERLWRRPEAPQPAAWLAGVFALGLVAAGLSVAMPADAGDGGDGAGAHAATHAHTSAHAGAAALASAAAEGKGSKSRHRYGHADDHLGQWTWAATVDGDKVQLSLSLMKNGSHRQHSFPISRAALGGDLQNGFSLKRDAGTFTFTGEFKSDGRIQRGAGLVEFTPDNTFPSRLAAIGWSLPDGEIFDAALHDINTTWAASLAKAGYGPRELDWDDLLAWRIHDVEIDNVVELGEMLGKKLPADQAVAFAIHDVSAAYARELIRTFGKLDAEKLVGMAIHDVDPQEVEAFDRLGLGKLDADHAMALAIHDVDVNEVAGMQRAGWEIDDVDQVLNMKIHGVDQAYADDMAELGYANLGVEKLVAWKIHDVDANWVRGMADLDLGELDADALLKLKIHDVTPEYIEGFRREKIQGLDADAVTAMAIHGVDLDMVKKLRSRGFDKIDADDLVDYAIHGRRWERGN